jgi:hypothetical protein
LGTGTPPCSSAKSIITGVASRGEGNLSNPISAPARIPGQGWYVLAGAVALAGFLAAAALIVSLVLRYDRGTQFVAPGSKVLELAQGKHVLWNDYVTMFEGRAYEAGKNLPDGAQITVTDGSGASLSLRGASGASFRSGSRESVSVIEFEVTRPGRHEIAVRGNFAPRVFSVGPDFVWVMLCSIFGAIGSVLLGIGAGVGIAAWAFLARDRAREAAAARATSFKPQGSRYKQVELDA